MNPALECDGHTFVVDLAVNRTSGTEFVSVATRPENLSAPSWAFEAARINLIRRPSASKLKPSVFVARGLVVRALRHAGLHHVLRREPCTFGLVGVEAGSVDAVTSAVREIMKAPPCWRSRAARAGNRRNLSG